MNQRPLSSITIEDAAELEKILYGDDELRAFEVDTYGVTISSESDDGFEFWMGFDGGMYWLCKDNTEYSYPFDFIAVAAWFTLKGFYLTESKD